MPNAAIAAMAATAGDKLKTSARELLKNLEAWKNQEMQQEQQQVVGNKESTLESTIRLMFGSCSTAPNDALRCEDLQYTPDPIPTQQRKRSSSSKINLVTPTSSPDRKPSSQGESKSSRPQLRHQRSNATSAARTAQTNGEHIYEQLFMDENDGRHTRTTTEGESKPQHHRLSVQTTFTKPGETGGKIVFPTPTAGRRHPHSTMAVPAVTPTRNVKTPLGSNDLIVPNHTFDDSISTISAQTLEAMAQAQKLQPSPSNDSSLFPTSSRDTSPHPSSPKTPPTHVVQASPMTKSRSSPWGFQQRKRSENSKKSENTNSTQSTEDTSMDHHKWMNGEQAFWDMEALSPKQQGSPLAPKPYRRAKSQTSRKTGDLTVSTSSTSHCSFAHPHDTVPFESGDFVASDEQDLAETAFHRDPNRIDQVLVSLPVDAEMAEI